jgi:hypothetical protein
MKAPKPKRIMWVVGQKKTKAAAVERTAPINTTTTMEIKGVLLL